MAEHTTTSYQATLAYLYRLQRVGIKYSLDNISYLLRQLGNPHRELPVVHIAGTNGKGSTAAMIFAIARAANLSVGLYTSPHLMDFRERIRVNDQFIPADFVVAFVRAMRPLIERIRPSFFEVTTAMAFQYFSQMALDLVIVEAGMGGRLDSTNVVHPLVTLLTPIGLDHQNFLGNSLAAIAREKAGILKPGVPAITNNTHPRVVEILKAQAEAVDTWLQVLPEDGVEIVSTSLEGTTAHLQTPSGWLEQVHINLLGAHQVQNARLAVAAVQQLARFLPLSEKHIYQGLSMVQWRGRLEVVRHHPPIVVDVSHNPIGMETSLRQIKPLLKEKPFNIIIGLQEDKDFRAISKIVARFADTCYVTGLPTPKQLDPVVLQNAIQQAGGKAIHIKSLEPFLKQTVLKGRGTWLITGSHYLVGEVLPILEKA